MTKWKASKCWAPATKSEGSENDNLEQPSQKPEKPQKKKARKSTVDETIDNDHSELSIKVVDYIQDKNIGGEDEAHDKQQESHFFI